MKIFQLQCIKTFLTVQKRPENLNFILEAIFLEYAAIEGRLEVLCGIFGFPCNKDLEPSIRTTINITQRVKCLKSIYKDHPVCVNRVTKLDSIYWKNLERWIKRRNTYVHGLYKRAEEYVTRGTEVQELAEQGYEYTRLLYNEVKRVRRLTRNHPDEMIYTCQSCKGKCKCCG